MRPEMSEEGFEMSTSQDPRPCSRPRQGTYAGKSRYVCDFECRIVDPESGLRCGNIFEGPVGPSHKRKSCGCLRRINGRRIAAIGLQRRQEIARKRAEQLIDAELAKLDASIERKTGKKA